MINGILETTQISKYLSFLSHSLPGRKASLKSKILEWTKKVMVEYLVSQTQVTVRIIVCVCVCVCNYWYKNKSVWRKVGEVMNESIPEKIVKVVIMVIKTNIIKYKVLKMD